MLNKLRRISHPLRSGKRSDPYNDIETLSSPFTHLKVAVSLRYYLGFALGH